MNQMRLISFERGFRLASGIATRILIPQPECKARFENQELYKKCFNSHMNLIQCIDFGLGF